MSERYIPLNQRIEHAISECSPHPVVEINLNAPTTARLDLSLANPIVANARVHDNKDVTRLLALVMERSGAQYGIGGYGEKRGWYARGEQFTHGEEVRSIHLGVDIWAPAGTPVYSPLDGIVHSFQDNALFGDYGPTIILQHSLQGETVYTLYGHLSRESLAGLVEGEVIRRGERFATRGAAPINGDWPPHLHFQIMIDMLGKVGDYPGVAAESQRELFLTLCPDPNFILRSPLL